MHPDLSARAVLPLLVGALTAGCLGPSEPDPPAIRHDVGADPEARVVRIGTLNDESGPARAIGTPWATGKRVLAARVNAGESGLLPEGWTVELIERDHGYDPQVALRGYAEIRNQVLFIGTSFGTATTLALRPLLEEDGMVAFPASLASEMSKHPYTPPLAASYATEAGRAMDFVVERAGRLRDVRAAVVFQSDPYGTDARDGFREAAVQYGVELVAERPVEPGAKDLESVVAALQEARATHVLVALMPSTTLPLLRAAREQEYAPLWVGATPAWIDCFFDPAVAPPELFETWHQATSLPFWGEDLPGMDTFEATFRQYGGGADKDGYVLHSYVQGLAQLEATRRAIGSGDVTREGFLDALTSMRNFDGEGIIRPINLSRQPWRVAEEVRILAPDFEARSWTSVMAWAVPGRPPHVRPGQEALDDPASAAHPPGEDVAH